LFPICRGREAVLSLMAGETGATNFLLPLNMERQLQKALRQEVTRTRVNYP
jgi:hypothetical protein